MNQISIFRILNIPLIDCLNECSYGAFEYRQKLIQER